MEKNKDGVYFKKLKGDLGGKFYTYLVDNKSEVTDPYSYASSMNSLKSAIIDLDDTDPVGWKSHKVPYHDNICKSVIYEVHVKDFTIHESSGVKHRGKYLGFVEEASRYKGLKTGIDHLKELGITHVHLMPVYDFLTVDEDPREFYKDHSYNWGYDPELYNVPEGSYSLKPEDPKERIRELKTLIMELHKAGISVVLDVVYNHTYRNEDSNLNILYPNYYYRTLKDGSLSDGSGVGNELATEREMVKSFIKTSLIYWLKEFKVDGFRFDLMGLIDKNTTHELVEELKALKKDILIYGEPWIGGLSALPFPEQSLKGTQYNKDFAFFNDEFRDAIKGDNNGRGIGFVQGNMLCKNPVETGLVGSIAYDANHQSFTAHSTETINYANSHDNLILADKLEMTFPKASHEELVQYNKFALSLVLMAQGIPFIHAGNEFLRSKNMDYNSYNKPISVNAIDWSLKKKNLDLFNYTKDLIHFKKNSKVFNFCDPEKIRKKINFLDTREKGNLISYTTQLIKNKKYFIFVFNGNGEEELLCSKEIKDHLSYKLARNIVSISLRKHFDMGGYALKKKPKLNPKGILTEARSTEVWEITIN